MNTTLVDDVELTTFHYELEKGSSNIERLHHEGFDEVDDTQSIEQFLSRYRPPSSNYSVDIKWDASQTAGSLIASFDPLRQICWHAQVWNHLKNFTYLNCSAQMRFQVTGNQFYSGKLIAVWIPPNRLSEWANAPPSLPAITGTPYQVVMYATMNDTVELKIPLMMPDMYMTLQHISADWNLGDSAGGVKYITPTGPNSGDSRDVATLGLINIYVLCPFQGQDETASANVQVWARLTDIDIPPVYTAVEYSTPVNWPGYNPATHHIELNSTSTLSQWRQYCTDASVFPNPPTPGEEELRKFAHQADEYTFEYTPPEEKTPARPRVQKNNKDTMKPKGGPSISFRKQAVPKPRKEKQEKQKGIVQSIAEMVASGAGALMAVPGPQQPFVAAARYLSGALASIASAFNWDKPRQVQPACQEILQFKDFVHGDGVDQTMHLGILVDSERGGR